MGTVAEDLDLIQGKLHDAGELWTRGELLRWFNDGYRQLLSRSGAVRRFTPMEIPGRTAYAITYEWEAAHIKGTYRVFTYQVQEKSKYQVTYRWEAEELEGVTPSNSEACYTYDWERGFGDSTDRHYRFYLPKDHERLKWLGFNDRKLDPVSVKELDWTDKGWMRQGGEPRYWTLGVGKNKTYEVFEIETTYHQAYVSQEAESGIPRQISGNRTYSAKLSPPYVVNSWSYTTSAEADYHKRTGLFGTSIMGDISPMGAGPYGGKVHGKELALSGLGWRFTYDAGNGYFTTYIWEKEMQEGKTTFTTEKVIVTYWWETAFGTLGTVGDVNFAVGTLRQASSPDRQYLPVWDGPSSYMFCGAARLWGTSEDTLLALEIVVPGQNLRETDRPELIPGPLQKYLRFYVLGMAFGREGEGHQPGLAAHFTFRFERGVTFFRRLGNIAYRDKEYARESFRAETRRIPRVRLPPEYPRVW